MNKKCTVIYFPYHLFIFLVSYLYLCRWPYIILFLISYFHSQRQDYIIYIIYSPRLFIILKYCHEF